MGSGASRHGSTKCLSPEVVSMASSKQKVPHATILEAKSPPKPIDKQNTFPSNESKESDIKSFIPTVLEAEAKSSYAYLRDTEEDEDEFAAAADYNTDLYHRHHAERYGDQDDFSEPEYSPRSETDAANAEMFAVTAMSLGMESDDLLFNLMYFGGEDVSNTNIGTMFNTAMEETVALYSENNTPYKLRPASSSAINGLAVYELVSELEEDCRECLVCRDNMEVGDEMVRLPACTHMFHHECIKRWLQLQGWCPVCRSTISNADQEDGANVTQPDKQVEPLAISIPLTTATVSSAPAIVAVSPCEDNYEKCLLSVCKSSSYPLTQHNSVVTALFMCDEEEDRHTDSHYVSTQGLRSTRDEIRVR